MVKAKVKAALGEEGFKYITALTNAQVRKHASYLPSCPIPILEGKRLIVRRNESVRARERHRREDKLARLREKIAERNTFVNERPRAQCRSGARTTPRMGEAP
jgi:predicted deacetylase